MNNFLEILRGYYNQPVRPQVEAGQTERQRATAAVQHAVILERMRQELHTNIEQILSILEGQSFQQTKTWAKPPPQDTQA